MPGRPGQPPRQFMRRTCTCPAVCPGSPPVTRGPALPLADLPIPTRGGREGPAKATGPVGPLPFPLVRTLRQPGAWNHRQWGASRGPRPPAEFPHGVEEETRRTPRPAGQCVPTEKAPQVCTVSPVVPPSEGLALRPTGSRPPGNGLPQGPAPRRGPVSQAGAPLGRHGDAVFLRAAGAESPRGFNLENRITQERNRGPISNYMQARLQAQLSFSVPRFRADVSRGFSGGFQAGSAPMARGGRRLGPGVLCPPPAQPRGHGDPDVLWPAGRRPGGPAGGRGRGRRPARTCSETTPRSRGPGADGLSGRPSWPLFLPAPPARLPASVPGRLIFSDPA